MEQDEFSNAVVDPEVRAYVYSLVTALGGTGADEDGRYILGDDALACLKDLKRWLKLHDERLNRLDVARCLAEANVVNGDLLEILASWSQEPMESKAKMKIALACLELLVPLTWPIEKNDQTMTVNHHRHTPYLQLAQLSYKRGVLNHSVAPILKTVVRIGLPSIAEPLDERTSRDEGIIKLVLYFLRNIAMISAPQNLPVEGDETEVSRSATIEAFHAQDILHLLLTISSSMGEDFNTQDVIVLEVLFHLLKGIDTEKLFMNEKQLETKKTNELQGLLFKELALKRENMRNAPTRHNRFGTMIWVKRDEERVSTVSGQSVLLSEAQTLAQMDKSKKWNKPRGRGGKKEDLSLNEFDMPVSLTPSATKHLRSFVEDFLDSAFNPLLDHIRKAIEREAERILDIHPRQFFYLVSWFLEAERMRRQANLRSRDAEKGGEEVDSFAIVASVLTQQMFIILTRFMRESYDMKQWQDLKAGMRCFTQILLTVQQMSESPLEDDQEIAENIQNRLFYEETTHDLIILILRNCNDQGFGYLDACTELVHVHLRLLERYSKQNVDMQVRSRRRTRRKKKKATNGADVEGGEENDESDEDDVAVASRTSTERKFDFKRFSAKFLSQSCVDTYVRFVNHYQDLNPEQLKRAHRFFYRVAFKMEMSVILFRVDIIALFLKMIKGPNGLDPANPAFKEWDELVRQVIRKLTKKMKQRPELAIEMLFSKTNFTAQFLEHGHIKPTASKKVRAPAELEIRPGMERDQQVGVAVAALLDQNKNDAVLWVKTILSKAMSERESWEAEATARQELDQEPSTEKEPVSYPPITVKPDNEERRVAMYKDANLRLLMGLVGFERQGDAADPDASWIIPPSIDAAGLDRSLDLVKMFENDPPTFPDDKEAADFIRRKFEPKPRSTTFGNDDDDDVEDDFIANEEEFLFPPGGPTNSKSNAVKELKAKRQRRRNGEEPDEAEVEERRKKREQANLEKLRSIKSALYVHESDEEEDEERDRQFFEREAKLRAETQRKALEAMASGAGNSLEGPTKGKAKGSRTGTKRKSVGEGLKSSLAKKRKRITDRSMGEDGSSSQSDKDGTDGESTSLSDDEGEAAHSPEGENLFTTDDEEARDTPLSSPHLNSSSAPKPIDKQVSPLSSLVSEPVTKTVETADATMKDAAGGSEDEDDDLLVASAPRRRTRIGGFIVDSDSE